MGAPVIVTFVSVGTLVFLTLLFVHEHKKGVRYGNRLRSYIDRGLDTSLQNMKSRAPTINSNFVRQFFHYLTHKILATMLYILRRFEHGVEKIAHFNRVKAQNTNGSGTKSSSHLTEIALHKERAELSEEEKRERRKQALEGD